MTPRNRWWARLLVLTLGLWAGGAAAQSEDDGGWFDEPAPSERPQLRIHGEGAYDPPPPDFQSRPSTGPRDRSGDEVVDEEPGDDVDVEDGESQQRAVREFSSHLAPYGYWQDDPFYGRVWVPSRGVVGGGFRPYVSGGHWELTPYDEWLWVSDYPFGWVTFHYGRWAWLSAGVWGWVPGYVWAPAWVDFRIGSSGYVGWGPIPPYAVWRGGAFISLGVRRPVPYIFCPTSYVFAPSLHRYVVRDRYRVRSIAASTYRYRPRYAAGSMRVRSPSPREAHIPTRYVPSRRVIAQPRAGYAPTDYRRRTYDKARAPALRGGEPRGGPAREPRYRSAPPVSRPGQPSPRYRQDDRSNGGQRSPGPAVDRQNRVWRSQPGQRRSDGRGDERRVAPPARGGDERRVAPPARGGNERYRAPQTGAPRYRGAPPAASDGARYRAPPPPAQRNRAAPSPGPSERRAEPRRSGSRSSPPPQQRSRDRDDRGSSR